MDVRNTVNSLVRTLEDPAYGGTQTYALGYLESFMGSIIESLPKAAQKRILADIEWHINARKESNQ